MCADTAELTFETMLADPLIRLMMQADGVSATQLGALLHRVAEARAEPPYLALVYCAPPRLLPAWA